MAGFSKRTILEFFSRRLVSSNNRMFIGIFIALLLLFIPLTKHAIGTAIDVFPARFITSSSQRAALQPTGKKPNIVFILADDYGWHDIGYHGSEIRTPNLDSLAADGVKLENYYVQPICSPSRMQFLTGRYQIHYGLQHAIINPPQPSGMPLDEVTLPQILKKSGYSTHIVGKWHVGFYKKEFTPTYRGFDTFYGLYNGAGDYYSHRRQGDMPLFKIKRTWSGLDLWDQERPVVDQNGTYSTHLFAKKVLDIIARHDNNKPLFLYVPFQAVHSPLQAPQKYIDMNSHINNTRRRIYAAMTSVMDEAVGNVTYALKKTGLWDNTVLIFSTDNGGAPKSAGDNWPLRGAKGGLWEGGVRGVGFVSSPLLKTKSRKSNALIHITDWFPTLVKIAGGSTNGIKPLDGHDVWETISEGNPSPRTEILHNIDPLFRTVNELSSHRWGDYIFNTSVHAAIRSGDWKLLTGFPGNSQWMRPVPSEGSWEESNDPPGKHLWLFNIRHDPEERNDLSEKHPMVVQKLLQKLAAYNKTAVPPFYPAGDPRANPALHGDVWSPWL